MPYYPDDTIVAIASAPGGAARGIVRVSGPGTLDCLKRVFVAAGNVDLSSVRAATCIVGSARMQYVRSPLPCEAYLWPGRRSYTGQPTAELHTLGSRPLLESLVRTLCAAGARLAAPGEFTLRAFLAGRIDLTQAEAVLGVVDARDQRQLDVALAQLAGGLAGPLGQLRERLLELLAHLEAGFDFPDEDVAFISPQQLRDELAAAAEAIQRLSLRIHARGDVAELPRAALVGWPNTGKSSLFNALSGKAGALVSHEPGTTRDYLVSELDLAGVRVRLIDTAGVEPQPEWTPADLWEAVQAASLEQSRQADVQILCLDSSRPINAWERAELERSTPATRLVVFTKVDLRDSPSAAADAIFTSSVTGEGISALSAKLREAVASAGIVCEGMVAATATRCHEAVQLAAACLGRAHELADCDGGEELIAAELRTALAELGKVVGAVYTEDVLDRVFSRFCIGK